MKQRLGDEDTLRLIEVANAAPVSRDIDWWVMCIPLPRPIKLCWTWWGTLRWGSTRNAYVWQTHTINWRFSIKGAPPACVYPLRGKNIVKRGYGSAKMIINLAWFPCASSTSETLTQRTALRDVLFYFILFLFMSHVFMILWKWLHV